jgi:opacity protein-like surface antigen
MTLTLLALTLLGSAPASAASNDAVEHGVPEAALDLGDHGQAARTPTTGSRPTTASRPTTGGSRPTTSAPRPSTSSRPTTTAPRPTTSAPPSSRPPTAHPASRPSPPPTASRPPTARPPAARPGTPPTASRPPAARPPAARPGYAPARPPAVRPGYAPARPGYARPTYAPSRPYYAPAQSRVVYARSPYYVRPYSGVFVYGPRPVYHSVYYVNGDRPDTSVQVKEKHLPDRKVDRDDSFAIGLKGGSYFGAYQGANAFGDLGLGLTGRYRPTESLGLELGVARHLDNERQHTTGSASVELFAFPWTRVSPYVLGGATFTDRSVQDDIWRDEQVQTIVTGAPMIGAHAGLGVEFAIGDHLALDLEARYIGYLNHIDGDPTLPGAVTTGVGVLWHF